MWNSEKLLNVLNSKFRGRDEHFHRRQSHRKQRRSHKKSYKYRSSSTTYETVTVDGIELDILDEYDSYDVHDIRDFLNYLDKEIDKELFFINEFLKYSDGRHMFLEDISNPDGSKTVLSVAQTSSSSSQDTAGASSSQDTSGASSSQDTAGASSSQDASGASSSQDATLPQIGIPVNVTDRRLTYIWNVERWVHRKASLPYTKHYLDTMKKAIKKLLEENNAKLQKIKELESGEIEAIPKKEVIIPESGEKVYMAHQGKCIICEDNTPNCIYRPCKHVAICEDCRPACLTRKRNGCIVCGVPFTSIDFIY